MTRLFVPIMFMTISIIISGCAPAGGSTPSSMPVEEVKAEATTEVQMSQDTAVPNLPETVTAPGPIAVATSRGDKLVASDPALVNLAAGVPTLVEFFRFT